VEVVNLINAMHNNIILSKDGPPCQLEIGVFLGFLQLKHLYLLIDLKVPSKEEELLACMVIIHELDVVLVIDG
jgi:hypothetical protein